MHYSKSMTSHTHAHTHYWSLETVICFIAIKLCKTYCQYFICRDAHDSFTICVRPILNCYVLVQPMPLFSLMSFTYIEWWHLNISVEPHFFAFILLPFFICLVFLLSRKRTPGNRPTTTTVCAHERTLKLFFLMRLNIGHWRRLCCIVIPRLPRHL